MTASPTTGLDVLVVNIVAAGGATVVGGAAVVDGLVSGGTLAWLELVEADGGGVSTLTAVVVGSPVAAVVSLGAVVVGSGVLEALVVSVGVDGSVEAVVVPVEGEPGVAVVTVVSVLVLGSADTSVEVEGSTSGSVGSVAAGSVDVVGSGSGVVVGVLVATTHASATQKEDAARRRPMRPLRASARGAMARTAPIVEKMMMRLFIRIVPFRRMW